MLEDECQVKGPLSVSQWVIKKRLRIESPDSSSHLWEALLCRCGLHRSTGFKKNQPGVNTWVLHVPCLHILHFSPIPGSQPLLNLFISSFFPEWHGSYLWKLIKLKSFLFSLSLIRQQTFIKHQALTTFYEHCFLDKLPQDFTKNLEDNYVFVTGLSSYTFSVCAAVFSYVLDSCFCRHFKWLFSVLFLMQEQEEDRSLYRFT